MQIRDIDMFHRFIRSMVDVLVVGYRFQELG
jgi:hypothetical protein